MKKRQSNINNLIEQTLFNYFNMKKLFMAAAVMAMAFTSCNDDVNNNGENGNGSGDEKASMSLSFKMPASNFTRAPIPADGGNLTATLEESTVKTVTVFVFEPNGNLASLGGFTHFANLDLFDTSVTGVYTLLPAEQIETTTGTKRIYVGVNLPTVLTGFSDNEAALLEATADIAGAAGTGMAADNNFTMFSDVQVVDLKANTDAVETTPENIVKVSVRRVVAKVVASTGASEVATDPAGQFTKEWFKDEATSLELVYSVKNFRVFQHTEQSYIAPNYWSNGLAKTLPGLADTPLNTTGDVFSDFATDQATTAVTIGAHPTTAETLVALDGFYIGENYPMLNGVPAAQNGNATYIMVATTVTANLYATWVDDDAASADPTIGHVEWVAAGGTYGGGVVDSDIYVIKAADGKHYVTNDEDQANAILAGTNGATTGVIQLYKDGYVHFQVFLNKNDSNDYSVLRNDFIHVKINDIMVNDYVFPGYPGLEVEPEIPEEPVDGENAYLQVEVTALPWTYQQNDTVLQ
jgi:hypothetical protein